jgi:hypothetical protein
MGQNLALNIASKGFTIAVHNRSSDKVCLLCTHARGCRVCVRGLGVWRGGGTTRWAGPGCYTFQFRREATTGGGWAPGVLLLVSPTVRAWRGGIVCASQVDATVARAKAEGDLPLVGFHDVRRTHRPTVPGPNCAAP